MTESVDLFVMDTDHCSAIRRKVEEVAAHWWSSIEQQLDIKFNLHHMDRRGRTKLEFAYDARQEAFTCPGTDIFILTDNDMLPFSGEHIKAGLDSIRENFQFAILSAWPEPHTFVPIELPQRVAINDHELMETYSAGGFRFCRKVPGLEAPQKLVTGYDGVFCRHLWSEHGKRVGYLKGSRAFHLGAHCTTLWGQP